MIKFIDVWKAFRMNKNGGQFVTLIQVMGRVIPFQVFGWVSKCKSANTKTHATQKIPNNLDHACRIFFIFLPKLKPFLIIFEVCWRTIMNIKTRTQLDPNPSFAYPHPSLLTQTTSTTPLLIINGPSSQEARFESLYAIDTRFLLGFNWLISFVHGV